MGKYVYLFELDSVRSTDKEILIGQKALHDEIVENGNIVVLTFNQLADSRGFFSLLSSPKYYRSIIKLFERGAIRISQFGEMRTIVQYLINALDYDRKFVFSGWPLKSTQKRLLALIRRSLIYSDLTEITNFIDGSKYDSEILDLFVELSEKGTEEKTSYSIYSCREILKNLYWLLNTVLRLSSMPMIYIEPKPNDKYDMSLPKFIRYALELEAPKRQRLWNDAVKVIKFLKNYKSENDKPIFDFDNMEGAFDRSEYHRVLKQSYEEKVAIDGQRFEKIVFQYAEAIIDICYNYQLEYSVCSSSKHYNLKELTKENTSDDRITFCSDFFGRLNQVWEIGSTDQRFLKDENQRFVAFLPKEDFPNFEDAVRINEYAVKNRKSLNESVKRYEFKIKEQRRHQKIRVLRYIGNRLLMSFVCILIVYGIEMSVQWISSRILSSNEASNFVYLVSNAVKTVMLLALSEAITLGISNVIPGFMSLSEVLKCIGTLIKDFADVILHKAETYTNKNVKGVETEEIFREGAPIQYIKSNEIKKYIALRKKYKAGGYIPFEKYNGVYELANVIDDKNKENAEVIKNLIRTEEITGCRFGVVYASKYNTLLVDSIVKRSSGIPSYYPYERIIPTSGNGVVMVTMHNNNFVILKQFRHAPRKIQYGFPRGYAENGLLSIDNAKEELKQELNAVLTKEPILIGHISPDSGLTSTCAYVYYVDLDNYSKNIGHEGIIDLEELSFEKIKELIYSSNCNAASGISADDGFTLAALMLTEIYLERVK